MPEAAVDLPNVNQVVCAQVPSACSEGSIIKKLLDGCAYVACLTTKYCSINTTLAADCADALTVAGNIANTALALANDCQNSQCQQLVGALERDVERALSTVASCADGTYAVCSITIPLAKSVGRSIYDCFGQPGGEPVVSAALGDKDNVEVYQVCHQARTNASNLLAVAAQCKQGLTQGDGSSATSGLGNTLIAYCNQLSIPTLASTVTNLERNCVNESLPACRTALVLPATLVDLVAGCGNPLAYLVTQAPLAPSSDPLGCQALVAQGVRAASAAVSLLLNCANGSASNCQEAFTLIASVADQVTACLQQGSTSGVVSSACTTGLSVAYGALASTLSAATSCLQQGSICVQTLGRLAAIATCFSAAADYTCIYPDVSLPDPDTYQATDEDLQPSAISAAPDLEFVKADNGDLPADVSIPLPDTSATGDPLNGVDNTPPDGGGSTSAMPLSQSRYLTKTAVDNASSVLRGWGAAAASGRQITFFNAGGTCSNTSLSSFVSNCSNPSTNASIAHAMRWWINGFASQKAHYNSGAVDVVVTANNGRDMLTGNADDLYGQLVSQLQTYANNVSSNVNNNGGNLAIRISGGVDAENGTGFVGATNTLPWMARWQARYAANATKIMQIQDEAWFTSCSTASCWDSNAGGGWTTAQMYQAIWGYTSAFSGPQIYSKSFPQNYRNLDVAATAKGKSSPSYLLVLAGCGTGGNLDNQPGAAYNLFARTTGDHPGNYSIERPLSGGGC